MYHSTAYTGINDMTEHSPVSSVYAKPEPRSNGDCVFSYQKKPFDIYAAMKEHVESLRQQEFEKFIRGYVDPMLTIKEYMSNVPTDTHD